ncbi:MAG: hypothetical protein FGM29_02390 [Actinobacteria bacterium]|nr:hypothetical protein [Actinomycetota bacterium]
MFDCGTLDGCLRNLRRRHVPDEWANDGRLGHVTSIEELVALIRGLDQQSDDILRALLVADTQQETASEVILAALVPFVLARCVGRPDRVDEFLAELAIVIGEERHAGVLRSTTRRVANQMLDRAWGRVRLPARRVHQPIAVDPVRLHRRLLAAEPDPADLAAERVDLAMAYDQMSALRRSDAAVDRAWKTAAQLIDVEGRTESERQQLNYARRILRRSIGHEKVA